MMEETITKEELIECVRGIIGPRTTSVPFGRLLLVVLHHPDLTPDMWNAISDEWTRLSKLRRAENADLD